MKDDFPRASATIALRREDIVRLERPGGGGLGIRSERPVEKVLEDVRQGYVSSLRARSDYGVAVPESDGASSLNAAETACLRGKIEKNTGKLAYTSAINVRN